MNNGQLTITVPTGWTAPTVGNTTSTKGTVSVAGQVITVSNLDLAASGTVDITYSGVTVGSTTGTGICIRRPAEVVGQHVCGNDRHVHEPRLLAHGERLRA